MKKFILIVLLVFAFSACSKEEEAFEKPEWMLEWIAELEADGCDQCEIHQYMDEEGIYYELYSPAFSCRPCHMRDAAGNPVDLSTLPSLSDHMAHRKRVGVVHRF
jgi:hypothetical protein